MSDNTISPLGGGFKAYSPMSAAETGKGKESKSVEELVAELSDALKARDETSMGEEAKEGQGSNKASNADPIEELLKLLEKNLEQKSAKKTEQPEIPKPQFTQDQSSSGRCAAGSG
ncbi:MAG: hypothetical protein AB9903_15705 [Vulcanimicrobiota bacterium]